MVFVVVLDFSRFAYPTFNHNMAVSFLQCNCQLNCAVLLLLSRKRCCLNLDFFLFISLHFNDGPKLYLRVCLFWIDFPIIAFVVLVLYLKFFLKFNLFKKKSEFIFHLYRLSQLLNGFFRVAVTRMARKNRRLQLQRWRRGTSHMLATVSGRFLCNVRVSCMSARGAFAFSPERQKQPFCHAWCDLKDPIWNLSFTS